MKKLILLSSFVVAALGANAQISLSGAGPYTQSFSTLGSGIPTGWSVYSGAIITGLGTLGNYSSLPVNAVYGTDTTCGNTTGGFKNLPSANTASMEGASCSAQMAATDRALGVRQVSATNAANPNLDSGAAFVFHIANTFGGSNFQASFKLQSLDTTSPRITTWKVQYRIGTTGSFTDVTPTGTDMTTGGNAFKNTTVNVNFGTAIDNKFNVYIRIVAIDPSTGSGNRASTGIDDFNLSWTGTLGIADVNGAGSLPLTVLGDATTSDVKFAFSALDAGEYTLALVDMTGRVVYNQKVNAKAGEQTISVDGLSLTPGMYVARLSNGTNSGVAKVAVK